MTFEEALAVVRDRTMLSEERLRGLWDAVQAVNAAQVPGVLVECGCFQGGSAALLGLADDIERPLLVFDTFEGMPEPGWEDGERAKQEVGKCRASAEDVQVFLCECGLGARAVLVRGDVSKTLWRFHRPTAVLHIDCDWYKPVRACLDLAYDFVMPGGIIQIDDYGHWEGARKAVDEFMADRGIEAELKILDYTGVQLCVS